MRGYIPGLVLAAAAGLLVWGGDLLGLDLEYVALLGAALGGAVGLVPDRSPLLRAGGLLTGAIVAWIGYGVRAAILPDTSGGRAVAAVSIVLLSVLIAFLASGRLPLWTMLIGIAAVIGAYEESYTEAPAEFLTTSPSAMTTVLLTASLGFLATTLFGSEILEERIRERDATTSDDDPNHADTVVDLDGRGNFLEGTLR